MQRCVPTARRLDKRKFFFVGVGMFSGVTTVLYPLTVIKTRQMAAHRDVAAGMSGARLVASQILKQDGVR
jgi:solute carrier family 25 protein 44